LVELCAFIDVFHKERYMINHKSILAQNCPPSFHQRIIRAVAKTNKESREELLAAILEIIGRNPGIRPSELNYKLNLEHSAILRNTLIKRGLIRKERDGSAVHYYAIGKIPR